MEDFAFVSYSIYPLALFGQETYNKENGKKYHPGETQYLQMENCIEKEIRSSGHFYTFPRFGGSFPKGGSFKSLGPSGKISFISRSSDNTWILITYSCDEGKRDILTYIQPTDCYYEIRSLASKRNIDDHSDHFSHIESNKSETKLVTIQARYSFRWSTSSKYYLGCSQPPNSLHLQMLFRNYWPTFSFQVPTTDVSSLKSSNGSFCHSMAWKSSRAK